MKVVCVIDNVTNLNNKLNLLQTYFGNDILFVSKVHFRPLVETFGYAVNAIYSNDLAKTIHAQLLKFEPSDVVIYYTSLEINENLINQFVGKIANGNKIVSIMPKYNWLENLDNKAYNLYVQTIFKQKDSLVSPKLQFIPKHLLNELLKSHIANRMFENDSYMSKIVNEDKSINSSLKIKNKFNQKGLIPLIIALIATMALIGLIALKKVNFLIIMIFIFIYVVDAIIAVLYRYKSKFDNRYLK